MAVCAAGVLDGDRRALWGEVLVLLALLGLAAGTNFLSPSTTVFLERDPALSFPLWLPATVTTSALIAYSVAVPLVVLAVGHVTLSVRGGVKLRTAAASLAWAAVSLAVALGLALAITNVVKNFVGRQRPNFFAYCDYVGYRDAIATGNLTAYEALTAAGARGDAARCAGGHADVAEAQRSFPSGHASFSFAGLTWCALYARHALGVPALQHVTAPAAAAASPLLLATWITLTRVRDRYHNVDDVVAGAALGALAAVLAWRHYVARRRHEPVLASATTDRGAGSGGGSVGGDGGSGGYGTAGAVPSSSAATAAHVPNPLAAGAAVGSDTVARVPSGAGTTFADHDALAVREWPPATLAPGVPGRSA